MNSWDTSLSFESFLAKCPFLLNHITLPVSIIKIDTEGYELEVLKGAVSLLKEHRPTIVMEFNFESYSLLELKHHIPSHYSYFELPKQPYEGFRLVQDDLLYCCELLLVPDEKLV